MTETRALLLTDLIGSTELAETLGDVAIAALQAAHDEVARDLLIPHHGREIDKTDGFLLLFGSAADAVDYAVAYHRALGAMDPPLMARAGLHVGPVILTENAPRFVARGAKPLEVDGLAKPIAARVMSVAQGGQTLLTQEAVAGLGERPDLTVESHGHWRMKGRSEPVELFEVGGAEAPFTPPPDSRKVHRVVFDGEDWVPLSDVPHGLPAERGPFVGRHEALLELSRLLDAGAHAVSILGDAGIGKSRLALHYGWRWRGDYAGGVWHDPTLDEVRGARDALVILDGADVDLDALAPAQAILVGGRVPGSEVLQLGPLDARSAVELFAVRAAAVQHRFDLDAHRDDVTQLVELLGHRPRAIEDAAARIRVMSPRAQILRLGHVEGERARREVVPVAPGSDRHTARALAVTDVVDSTRLSESLGDARMAALWAAHDRAARDTLVAHGGREIDKTDGFVMLFDAVGPALAWVADYHRAVAALDPPLTARAGVHVGEVALTVNAPAAVARGAKPLDVTGPGKQLAELVMTLAEGGQTLCTEPVGASAGHWRLKGLHDPIELFSVDGGVPPDGQGGYRVERRGDLWLPIAGVDHTLPDERDAFVGRRADLDRLRDVLVGGASLVSVVGMGGTGKTRFVQRFGWSWLGEYPGGVWFCDLSEARDVDGIVAAVARALDVTLGASDPVEGLGHVLGGRDRCLVLLDNFEQVAPYAQRTLGRWMDLAPQARFVVTTRELLALPGEQVLALEPLPDADSVSLFAARAAAARPDFDVGAHADAVGDLVRLLDGLPLAIELAAAQLREVGLEALLSGMSERFEVLQSSGTGGRQATLRAVLDGSWDLMSQGEKLALAQLSVFEGGFGLDLAEAVLDLSGRDLSTMDAVQALVDKSLVRPVADDRFDLLVTVQAYATEKLDETGLREPIETRHGQVFAARGDGERSELVDDADNLIAACRRAVGRGDAEVATACLGGSWTVFAARGPYGAAIDLARAVLAMPSLAAAERAAAEEVLGQALTMSGGAQQALPHLERALGLRRGLGDAVAEASLQLDLANAHLELGHADEAGRGFDDGLRIALREGATRVVARVRCRIGWFHQSQGRSEEARAEYVRALTVCRDVGDRGTEGAVLSNLASLERMLGVGDARSTFDAALQVHRELGQRRHEAATLYNLGILVWQAGELDAAQAHYEQAGKLFAEAGDRRGVVSVHSALGAILHGRGALDEARARFQAAVEGARALDDRRNEATALGNVAAMDLERGDVEAAAQGFEDAVALSREVGANNYLGHALGQLARVRLQQGRTDEARALADESLRIRRADVLERDVALAEILGAEVALAEGRPDLARQHAERAVAFTSVPADVQVEALAVLTRAHAEAGDLALARASAERAAAFGVREDLVVAAMARVAQAEERAGVGPGE